MFVNQPKHLLLPPRNCTAKLATGLADDLLSASFLSFSGPKILFQPCILKCMKTRSLKNIALLRDSGVIVINQLMKLACGDTGNGRLPDQSLITDIIQFSLLLTLTYQINILLLPVVAQPNPLIQCTRLPILQQGYLAMQWPIPASLVLMLR